MNTENIKSQMRKGILEYCTLLILSKKRAYVSDITLYPLLTRLKNAGLLDYEWEESPQGPPRKYYRLTETGRAFLNELESAWTELNRTVEHIREI